MLLSVVIPVRNEAGNIHSILDRLRRALSNLAWEIIFVDDGSTDETSATIRELATYDRRIRLLRFSRNFGRQAAVTAGLDFAEGDAVVVMDGDLQDPPELLPRMVSLFAQGYDVVSPQHHIRAGESFFTRVTAKALNRVMASLTDLRLTSDVSNFRLFSRRAVLALRSLREQHRFVCGMASWLGLREVVIPFERSVRVRRHTRFSLVRMLGFVWTALASSSAIPLRLSITLGALLSLAGFVYLIRAVYLAMYTRMLVPGWASVVALECAFSGMILLVLGVAGNYIARTCEEVSLRPLYVIADGMNLRFPHRMPDRVIALNEPQFDVRNSSPLECYFPQPPVREPFNFPSAWR